MVSFVDKLCCLYYAAAVAHDGVSWGVALTRPFRTLVPMRFFPHLGGGYGGDRGGGYRDDRRGGGYDDRRGGYDDRRRSRSRSPRRDRY